MVAQDHHRLVAEIAGQALALLEVERDAFVIMEGDVAVEEHRRLRQRQQPAIKHRQRHPRLGMQVDDAAHLRPRGMDRAVDGEPRRVDGIRRVADDLAVEIDLDEVGRGDLLEGEPERVDEKMMLRPGHAGGDVVVDELVPALAPGEAVARRKLDPRPALVLARRCVGENPPAAHGHRLLHCILLGMALSRVASPECRRFHPLRRKRQIAQPRARRMRHGVGDGGRGRTLRRFAGAQ